MNSHHLLRLALCFAALIGLAFADPILDTFSDPALNPQWTALLPCARSSLTIADGQLYTVDRGTLVTTGEYHVPYIMSGAFTLRDCIEHFNIALRTDLSDFGTCFERSGLIVTFVNDGQGICLQQYHHSVKDWEQVFMTPYGLESDKAYRFSLTDTGDNVSLTLDGAPIFDVATTFGTGSHIALYSREFGGGTSIDNLSIVDVPDQSGTLGLVATAFGVMAWMGRRGFSRFATKHA